MMRILKMYFTFHIFFIQEKKNTISFQLQLHKKQIIILRAMFSKLVVIPAAEFHDLLRRFYQDFIERINWL